MDRSAADEVKRGGTETRGEGAEETEKWASKLRVENSIERGAEGRKRPEEVRAVGAKKGEELGTRACVACVVPEPRAAALEGGGGNENKRAKKNGSKGEKYRAAVVRTRWRRTRVVVCLPRFFVGFFR